MNYKWNILQNEKTDIVSTLLQNRGIEEKDAAAFLEPNWERDTFHPTLFTRMADAVARAFVALERCEVIRIHGDYDADGVSGSSLLYLCITQIAKSLALTPKIDVFLPDRERDGYGVAMHTVEQFGKEGVQLIITVDCGIANVSELARAHELGMDVIICDHHQLAPTTPDHAIIIHPLAPGEEYPNKTLCGTGVAFKLASALIEEARKRGAELPQGYEKWFLDFVAIATVTDVMPILGENRTLEKFGLLVLNKTRHAGIRKIIEYGRGEFGKIDTQTIGFQIGPRINAAGRVKSARAAFKALTAESDEVADAAAQELEMLNRERKRITDRAYAVARTMAAERESDPVHVVWDDAWHPGVVGLIAGKLVGEFGVPVFALTRVGEHYVGSGRSAGGLHLVEAMRACGDIFIKAGGHPQACGLTIANVELVETFRERMSKVASEFFAGALPVPTMNIETVLNLQDVNWDVYGDLQKFEPFGEKNPRPKFLAQGLQVITAEAIGKEGKHLRLMLTPGSATAWKGIGFNIGHRAGEIAKGDIVDIVYELRVNEWNGRRNLEVEVLDFRKAV